LINLRCDRKVLFDNPSEGFVLLAERGCNQVVDQFVLGFIEVGHSFGKPLGVLDDPLVSFLQLLQLDVQIFQLFVLAPFYNSRSTLRLLGQVRFFPQGVPKIKILIFYINEKRQNILS